MAWDDYPGVMTDDERERKGLNLDDAYPAATWNDGVYRGPFPAAQPEDIPNAMPEDWKAKLTPADAKAAPPQPGGTFVPGAMPDPNSLETSSMVPSGSFPKAAPRPGGTFVPGAMPDPNSLSETPAPSGSSALEAPGGGFVASPDDIENRIRGRIGEAPKQSDFQPKELHGWRKGLGALFTGMAAYGNPEAGAKVYDELFNDPRRQAQQQFQTASADYQRKLANELGIQRETREEQTARDTADFHKSQMDLTPVTLRDGRTVYVPRKDAERLIGTDATNAEHLQGTQETNQTRQNIAENKKPPEKEQEVADLLEEHGWPDDAKHRDMARKELSTRNRQEPGSFMPIFDPKSGKLTGAWDPKSGRVVTAPEGGGTTQGGLTEQDKRQAAINKEAAPFKNVIDEADAAEQLKLEGDKGNAEADVGLALTFFKAMRSGSSASGSGIRFTQQENNLIMGSRSLMDAIEVKGNKVFANGQPLSSNQRNEIMTVINIYKEAAKRRLNEIQQGGNPNNNSTIPTGGNDKTGESATTPAGHKSFKDIIAERDKKKQQP